MKYRNPHLADTRSSVLLRVRDTANAPAWEQFFDQYAPYVFALARRSGLQEADADEVLQTVMIEVANALRTFEYDRAKGRFRSWLSTCAHRRVTDLLRVKYRRESREIGGLDRTEDRTEFLMRQADPGPDRFKEMADEEWADLVRNLALQNTQAAVSPKQFSLFHAYVAEEWPVDKVMKTYGVTRDQVYQAKRRVGQVFARAAAQAERDLDQPMATPPPP
jgi:RNA polymerase sigma factor (sigma-70 family)